MIKIQLSPEDIEEIKNIYWKDMKNQATGLVKELERQEAKDLLKQRKYNNCLLYTSDAADEL